MLAPRHWEFGWFLELSVVNSWVLGWVFLGGRGDLLFCFALGVVVYGSFLGEQGRVLCCFSRWVVPFSVEY